MLILLSTLGVINLLYLFGFTHTALRPIVFYSWLFRKR